MNLFQQILSVSKEFREHFEKETQQEERLKDILNILSSLESTGTSSNSDIFSYQMSVAGESNIAIDKEEIINKFNMSENIDLSQYKAIFYVVYSTDISFDHNLFSANLVLGEDSVWKLNVVNQTGFPKTFAIFIVKKDSAYIHLFDVIDSIISRQYKQRFYNIGSYIIQPGNFSWHELRLSNLIHPSCITSCKYVSCTVKSDSAGIESHKVSPDIELKITTSYEKGYQEYKYGIQNNASESLAVNAVVLLEIDMTRS